MKIYHIEINVDTAKPYIKYRFTWHIYYRIAKIFHNQAFMIIHKELI